METQTTSPIVCPLCDSKHCALYMQKSGYSIYRCGTCDLRFVYPLPNSLENIYGEDYFAGAEDGFGYVDYDADKQPMVGAFKKYLQLIRRLRPGSKTLFDVGAATGFFLDVARQDGFDVSGVEISEYAAQKAREKGISVETGLLDTVDSSNAYDVITMLDLIEHVTDPLEILKKAHALLAPNGLIVINTPDAGSLYASMMGCRWHLIVPPEHLYYFNRKNIARILEQAGFRTRLITTIGKNFSVPYVLRTLHGWLGWNVFGSLADWSGHSFLKHISLPINLGDNMFVIAEKI